MLRFVVACLFIGLRLVSCDSSAGGIHDGNTEDQKSQELALFAVDTINGDSNAFYRSRLVQVNAVRKQVVSGVKYFLDIIIAETECTSRDGIDISSCSFTDDGKKELCSVTIWEKSWENFRQVQEKSCKPLKPTKPYTVDFDGFCAKFNKTYEDKDEYNLRKRTYEKNMQTAALMNEYEQGTAVYGETMFSDMTREEFKKYYTSGRMEPKYNPMMKKANITLKDIPDAFDWRDHNAVTPVKNQGSCGSCWAFSTTGNIEGQWAINKNKLIPLSEQELVDCDKIDDGCQGGLPSDAYTAIMQLGGLEDETDYPYKGRNDKCSFKKGEVAVTITGALNISSDEQEMATWLHDNGPISIGINAFAMQFYLGGIAHPWKIFCNPNSLDHGVLIVGYGVKGSKPYWIVKNSWGASWGVQGYYLVYRGGGVCGLNRMCTSAVVN